MKHYKSSEDAKSSITFMNNADEHYANPPPPEDPDYVVMLPQATNIDLLKLFATQTHLQELIADDFAGIETAMSSSTAYLDAVDVKSMSEAGRTPYLAEWVAARDSELQSMKSNGVMEEVAYEPWMSPLVDSKLVFKVKRNPNDTLDKFKVCWVARGFSEIFGRHYTETYSSVASI